MFFVASKLFFFLIRPLNWLFALLVYAWWTKNTSHRKKAVIAAVALVFFLGNHFVFNLVVRWWEPETLKLDEVEATYDIGILLGGYSDFYIVPNDDRHNFTYQGNRFFNTYELYKRGVFKKILLTGGSGEVFNQSASEAVMVKELLLRLGMKEEDIIIEPNSRNTYENGLFTKAILDKHYPNASCLLITSAWHMPRSHAIFKKLGIPVTPICVDYLSEKIKFDLESILQPDRLGFYNWEILIKEWVGYIVYKLRGYL